mmetsp:Transcript_6058/g.11717  ORF Transcript_6058/g.11717 Transcript_6058/m.11717 type:complete len:300 (+) Transcript_6058:495-1394(+)
MPPRVSVHACTLEAPILHKDAIYPNLRGVGVPANLCGAPHVGVVNLMSASVEGKGAANLSRHRPLIVCIRGCDCHDTVASARESDRELVGNVCKPPRLGERRALARHNDDLEALALLCRYSLLLLKPCSNLLLCLLSRKHDGRRSVGRWLRDARPYRKVEPLASLFGDLGWGAEETGGAGRVQTAVRVSARHPELGGGARRRVRVHLVLHGILEHHPLLGRRGGLRVLVLLGGSVKAACVCGSFCVCGSCRGLGHVGGFGVFGGGGFFLRCLILLGGRLRVGHIAAPAEVQDAACRPCG